MELYEGFATAIKPAPVRSFVLSPDCSFRELARAIDTAFGRWDLAHLSEFRVGPLTIGDDDEEGDLEDEAFRIQYDSAVGDLVEPGMRLTYEFDFGDRWLHNVVIDDVSAQPPRDRYLASAARAQSIVVTWGSGGLPDQYSSPGEADE